MPGGPSTAVPTLLPLIQVLAFQTHGGCTARPGTVQAVARGQGSACEPPPGQKNPTGHAVANCCVAPAGQKYPGGALQLPEQAGVVSPLVAPKVPAGHGVAMTEARGQNVPGGQREGDEVPFRQSEPAGQGAHTAAPVPELNVPAGHRAQSAAPPAQNAPAGQRVAFAGAVLPAGQKYPGATAQGPEQAGVVRPGAAPYTPAGHGVQAAAPAAEKLPAGHSEALLEVCGQAKPAGQALQKARSPQLAKAAERSMTTSPCPAAAATPAM